jgi:hypothetical protein
MNGSSTGSAEEVLGRVEGLLREILKWMKFAGAKEVREVLATTLDTDQKKLIYHLSDGNRGSVEIAALAKASDRTVRRYWESWARRGIVDATRVRGGERYGKSFDPEDFGIRIPFEMESEGTSLGEQRPETTRENVASDVNVQG